MLWWDVEAGEDSLIFSLPLNLCGPVAFTNYFLPFPEVWFLKILFTAQCSLSVFFLFFIVYFHYHLTPLSHPSL